MASSRAALWGLTTCLLAGCPADPIAEQPAPQPEVSSPVADIPLDTGSPDSGTPDSGPPDVGPPDTDNDTTTVPDAGEVDDAIWLIDHALWTQLDAADDPFDDRPADAQPCPSPGGFDIVSGSFEVDTDFCLYMTAAQPSLVDLSPGWVIEAVLWHLDLLPPEKDPEAAEAHMVVRIGDFIVWEGVIPIPNKSAFIEHQIVLDQPLPQGTPVYFHVHNHGPNSYRPLRLTAEPPKRIE